MLCLTKKPDLEQCTQQLPEMVIKWQIKKLTVVKSQEEFEREVNKLGKLRHANLVQLKGKKHVEYMEDDVVVLGDLVREACEDGRTEECIDPKAAREVSRNEKRPLTCFFYYH